METDGLAGFSTNAVATRAGTSIGSLYQYFPRKDAQIGALIARETSLLLEEAQAAVCAPSGAEALRGLILACIWHQFRRPALARLLDYEEARLPLDADTQQVSTRFRFLVAEVLQRPDLSGQASDPAAARDVVAIIKGMVDTAGVDGEANQAALARRVGRAVSGYLGQTDEKRG